MYTFTVTLCTKTVDLMYLSPKCTLLLPPCLAGGDGNQQDAVRSGGRLHQVH